MVLTDGKFGSIGGGNFSLGSCGVNAGTALTYTLPTPGTGYELTRIVTYAGWGDNGRDEQHYTVAYSTVDAPTTFITLGSATFNPAAPPGVPAANRVTITPAGPEPLAREVAAIKFTFTTPPGENGWSGYAELSVFGTKSLQVGTVTTSNGNLVLTGEGGTPGAGYVWLTSTNAAAPIADWTTSTTGTFDSNGAYSNAIPVNPSEPARFFRLRTP